MKTRLLDWFFDSGIAGIVGLVLAWTVLFYSPVIVVRLFKLVVGYLAGGYW